jgi:hypothetical protein
LLVIFPGSREGLHNCSFFLRERSCGLLSAIAFTCFLIRFTITDPPHLSADLFIVCTGPSSTPRRLAFFASLGISVSEVLN